MFSNRRNIEHEANPDSHFSHILSSNYSTDTIQESVHRSDTASALLDDQQSQSHILTDNPVLYYTIQEPRNEHGARETITDERDVNNNYDTLEKVWNISAEQHYEFDDGKWDHDDNMIDETKTNVAECSISDITSSDTGHAQKEAEYHTLETVGTDFMHSRDGSGYSKLDKHGCNTGQADEGVDYDRLEATGSNNGHAQEESDYNTLELADSNTRHAHGITENN